jgi:low affinity Fe/Cu permease
MSVFNGMHVTSRSDGPVCATYRCDRFERMSIWAVRAVGCRWGFRISVLLILAWAASRPFFRYHEAWTTTFTVVTTSVTTLLIFLIQNAQNRELKAVQLKLDELIFAAKNARNELIHIEHLTEDQLDQLGQRYGKLADRHRGQSRLQSTVAPPGPLAGKEEREQEPKV